MNDSALRRMARKRVEFRQHLYIYIVINAFLIVLNIWSSPGFWWFLFILFFWGIGLVSHFYDAYMGGSEEAVEREFRKLKARKK